MKVFEIRDPYALAWELRSHSINPSMMADFEAEVMDIIENVRRFGDEALIRYTLEFDGVNIRDKGIVVSEDEVKEAYDKVSNKFIEAVEKCSGRIEHVERRLLKSISTLVEFEGGTKILQLPKPIEKVGCYIPRGSRGYPSTVLMTCIPAKVAGVKRISIATPPLSNGDVSPYVLVAADIVGVYKIYRVGGPQAIAALAFGTETIELVDKIVGPGGLYVSIAKSLVSKYVSIDMFAGPTEALIYVDNEDMVEKAAYDLVSQVEHGPTTLVGLLTTSKELVEKVENVIKGLKTEYPMLENYLSNIFIAYGDEEDCIAFINEYAPEHLHIYSENFSKMMSRVDNVGVILIGPYTPIPFSDYCLGTNHVLPTLGWAKSRQGLSVLDFIKIVRIGIASKSDLHRFGKYSMELANAEEFRLHAEVIKRLLKEDDE